MHIQLCSLSTTLGGVELRMGREARLLSRVGHNVSIAINLYSALIDWSKELQADGIPVFHYDPAPFLEQWWWLRQKPVWDLSIWKRFKLQYKFWRIARLLNKRLARKQASSHYAAYKPDLVHIFLPWSGFEASRLFLAHANRLPVVLSIRNAFPKKRWSQWHRQHYHAAFASVRGIYAISQSALDHFVDLYGEFIRPRTDLEIIHNSVDTHRFTPDETKRKLLRDRLNLPLDAPVVGFVGRIEKQKRPEALIETFFHLRQLVEDVRLVMVGTGPLEDTIRRKINEIGFAPWVTFAGWQHHVEDFIPGFDVVLQLSNNEGFGTSTVEAMACGVPVVGTDVPGTRDILAAGKGGLLVPLHDEQAAANACARILLDGSLRSQMSVEARKEALFQYTEVSWEQKILNFYDRVSAKLSKAQLNNGV